MSIEEKAEALAQEVREGDQFKSGSEVMTVTQVTHDTCLLGMHERYTWPELQRYLTIGAVKRLPSKQQPHGQTA